MKDAYGIPNRRGDPPPTPSFDVSIPTGGVVHVELEAGEGEHTFTPRMAPADRPVDQVWPFTPPKRRIWIEDRPDAAMLVVVLFGQVIDAAAINKPGTSALAEWSAWTLDPLEGSCHRSSYPAVASGTAAAILTKEGRDVVMLPAGALFRGARVSADPSPRE